MAKTILITGASSGIGKETARYFEEKGWNVAATMRTPEKVTDLPESGRLKKFRLDVQEAQTIQQAIADILAAFGQIDLLLNNAGYAVYGPLEEASSEQVRRQFDVNVIGLIELTQAVIPHMRERGSGTIINVSSVGGRVTTPYGSLYHSTKWAVEGLTESLRYELDPIGIRLRIIEPGGVKTDFGGRSMSIVETRAPEYRAGFSKMQEAMDSGDNWPSTPRDVAKVIYKAATASNGRLRYPVGNDAHTFLRIRRWLGHQAQQGLVKWFLKV